MIDDIKRKKLRQVFKTQVERTFLETNKHTDINLFFKPIYVYQSKNQIIKEFKAILDDLDMELFKIFQDSHE